MSATKAYTESGFQTKSKSYASSQASYLRKKLEVRNRIIELSKAAIAGDLRTRQLIDDRLMEIADRCMQKVPVIENGKCVGEWKFDARNANTALHLMGKDRGMFTEKVQIITDGLDGKTAEEIIEHLKASAVDLGRDVIRIMGEAVGLYEADRATVGEAKKPTVGPVSTVQ